MSKEWVKPRWKDWESNCIKKAFEEKIQHKVMAIALDRSITAVSKRIKKLGLRKPTPLRGRIKGMKNGDPWIEKTPLDFAKMAEILQTYAPLMVSQKGQWALKERYWGTAKPLAKGLERGQFIDCLRQENASFSTTHPFSCSYSKDPLPKKSRKEKSFSIPPYVTLSHIEEWAVSEGFHQVKEDLRQHGVFYWKDGKHFSKAQLLIYINQIRLENKLLPLAIYENESN